jgi:hypothetical protein
MGRKIGAGDRPRYLVLPSEVLAKEVRLLSRIQAFQYVLYEQEAEVCSFQ